MPAAQKKYMRVYDLLRDGCSTSQDIADAYPMPINLAKRYLQDLGERGLARRTNRVIRSSGKRPYVVWEPV